MKKPSEKDILKAYIKDFIQKSNNENLDCIVKNSIPVVWFGDIDKYKCSKRKVITIALNPSKDEFSEKRFELIDFANNSMDENIKFLKNTLNAYFRTNPYEWFNRAEYVLGIFNASYYDKPEKNTAIHIDIYTAIATDPTWGDLPKEAKKELQRTDLFENLLYYLDPDVILVSVNQVIFHEVFGKDKPDDERYQYEQNEFTPRGKKNKYYLRKYIKGDKLLFWIYNNQGSAFGLEHEFMKKSIEELMT